MIAVVFDMDGVIFDTEAICRRAWHACAGKYNIQDVDALLIPCIGANKQHMRKVFHEQLGEDFPVEAFDKDAREGFLRIEREEGIPVKKGARELLSWLKEQGAVVGLASSTAHDIVVQELTDAGLVDYFQAITGGDQITKSKPDPEIYLKTCQALDISPEAAFGIEDSYNGVRSASAAGLKTIMVPDLLPPTDEMRNLALCIQPDLLAVKDYFHRNK